LKPPGSVLGLPVCPMSFHEMLTDDVFALGKQLYWISTNTAVFQSRQERL
jgi:hypothetical protein